MKKISTILLVILTLSILNIRASIAQVNDIGVTAVHSPTNSVQTGDSMEIKVEVTNFGVGNQSSFAIWYQIGNQIIVTDTFAPTGGLASFDTLSYTFNAIATATDFIICAGTSLANDYYIVNDDDCSSIINVTPANIDAGIMDFTNPYTQDTVKVIIKNFGIDTLTSINVDYSIDNGMSWTSEVWTGSLASNEVDTFIFATTHITPIGNFSICSRTVIPNDPWLYNDMCCIAVVGTANNDVGVTTILSPITTVQVGDTMDVTIEVTNFGASDQSSFEIWYQIGTQTIVTETYTPAGGLIAGTSQVFTFNTTSIANTTNFTICAGTILANDSYPQNDDSCSSNIIVTPAAFDAGVISIGINSGGILYPVVVTAEIKNFGLNTLTSFNVEYTIDNGNSWTTESWTGSIATNEVDTFIFTTPFDQPLGNIYNICAITALTNDDYTVNDMFCNTVVIDAIDESNNTIFKVAQSYPNPAYGNIHINYTVPKNGDIKFELRNTLGQVIYTAEQASFTGKNIIEVDANKLASGVYYYSVVFDGQRITRKMIVNK